ncbi:MAG: hypothetical protein ACFNZS_07990 [Ottowia sp.]
MKRPEIALRGPGFSGWKAALRGKPGRGNARGLLRPADRARKKRLEHQKQELIQDA